MTYRKWLKGALATALTATLIAGCSQSKEPNVSENVPAKLVNAEKENFSLEPTLKKAEVSASANTITSPAYRPLDTTLPATPLSRRQVILPTIGGDTANTTTTESVGKLFTPGKPHTPVPSYSQRPVPAKGTSQQEVLATLGTPPGKLPGGSGKEVWDYGTYRVFFSDDKVAFTQVW